MKLNDMKRNGNQLLIYSVMLAMDKGYDNPIDIAVALGEPVELVTQAYHLIVEHRSKKSGK